MNVAFFFSYVVLWLVVIVQATVLIVAVRHIGILNLRLGGRGALALEAGPSVGEQAPDFESTDLTGRAFASPWRTGRRSLLVFVSATCGACPDVIPSIRAVRRSEPGSLEILLFTGKAHDRNREFAEGSRCPVIVDEPIVSKYGVDTTPYAIAVDQLGVVRAKGVVNHIEHLEGLLDYLDSPMNQQASVLEMEEVVSESARRLS